ncbi:MAG: hypothetical protein HY744_15625 [Deltaproteobacteria bacterium]|nr:hypothetical protein [Deltaproteobacteria bacterium]
MALDQLDPKDLPAAEQERRRVASELKQKATAAQQRQELMVAALHACDALMLFPNEREYLDLFDEIVLGVPDPLLLVPVATGAVHVATAAGRARVLMMQSRMQEALELVCAAVRVAPDIGYLDWVRRWLLVPHVVPALSWEVLFETAVKTAIEVTVGVPVPPDAGDPRLPNVRAAADYLAQLRGRFEPEPMLYVGEAMARRRLGDPAAAGAVAHQAVERFPQDWRARTALANTFGDAGRVEDALGQARAALQLRPDDMSPLHDAAVAYGRAGRHGEAAELFQELVSRDPNYPDAAARLHHARFLVQGSDADRQALLSLRERRWWDETVCGLAGEIDPPQPYQTVLPGPSDASAAAARQILAELGQIVRCCGRGAQVGLSLSARYPESPSVGVAFDAGLRALGASGTLSVEAAQAPEPDPRLDKAPTAYRIWAYEGSTPRKIYGQADPGVQQAVAAIAGQLFRREIWDPAARQLASSLGPGAVHALMAVLTDPPLPPPDSFDGVYWTYRCQIATAVVLSHLGPHPHEPACGALQSLLYGPSDWVSAAAIVALTWRAQQDPAARPGVEATFRWLRPQIPAQGYCPWEIVLAECLLALGGHDEATRQDLAAWIDRYHETLPRKNRVGRAERRYGGLTIEEYARFSLERDRILGTIGYAGPGAAIEVFVGRQVPPELSALCQRFGLPLTHPSSGNIYPFVTEWQEALNADPGLHAEFIEIQRGLELERQGVSRQEKAALDNILDGNMDMHLRMAQAQEAQSAVARGEAGDPDPVVFPGQSVARLSDYVGIIKGMQRGDMMGALAHYGLDMMGYAAVATAWGAKMAADPVLTEKFTRMMNG